MIFAVEDLSKQFGKFTAVDRVGVTFEEGLITAIIGPNGAGKTTFINLCTGLLKPTKGRIYFKTWEITNLPVHKRVKLGIARTFQIVNVFSGLSIIENIKIPLLSLKEVELEGKIHDLLKRFNLEDVKNKSASEISHGHQRLLEIAMALSTEPKLLFLDEPLAGLNVEDRKTILNIIKELKLEGITIIFIEHDIQAVLEVADKIIVMNKGKILAKGTPKEIQENEAVKEVYLGE